MDTSGNIPPLNDLQNPGDRDSFGSCTLLANTPKADSYLELLEDEVDDSFEASTPSPLSNSTANLFKHRKKQTATKSILPTKRPNEESASVRTSSEASNINPIEALDETPSATAKIDQKPSATAGFDEKPSAASEPVIDEKPNAALEPVIDEIASEGSDLVEAEVISTGQIPSEGSDLVEAEVISTGEKTDEKVNDVMTLPSSVVSKTEPVATKNPLPKFRKKATAAKSVLASREKRPALKNLNDVSQAPEELVRAHKRARVGGTADVASPKRVGRPRKASTPTSVDHPKKVGRRSKSTSPISVAPSEDTPKKGGRPKKATTPLAVASSETKSKKASRPMKAGAELPKASNEISRGPPDESLEGGWPDGWLKIIVKRTSGKTQGHTDRYWYSPETHKKFRSMVEIKRFMAFLSSCNGDENLAWSLFKSKNSDPVKESRPPPKNEKKVNSPIKAVTKVGKKSFPKKKKPNIQQRTQGNPVIPTVAIDGLVGMGSNIDVQSRPQAQIRPRVQPLPQAQIRPHVEPLPQVQLKAPEQIEQELQDQLRQLKQQQNELQQQQQALLEEIPSPQLQSNASAEVNNFQAQPQPQPQPHVQIGIDNALPVALSSQIGNSNPYPLAQSPQNTAVQFNSDSPYGFP